MVIHGINRHGGKSNSDLIIHASGDGFNELDMLCDAVLNQYAGKEIGTYYQEGSTADRTLKIARALKAMMNPLDNDPMRLFSTV